MSVLYYGDTSQKNQPYGQHQDNKIKQKSGWFYTSLENIEN